MIWIINVICLVNCVQAFLPSLTEIISRSRLCLKEGGHCPINIYNGLDFCCKPLVCTVIPKTCKPNFINKYLKISEYKDYRCMAPAGLLPSTESTSQRENLESFESTSVKNEIAVSDSFSTHDYPSDTNSSAEGYASEVDTSNESVYNESTYSVLSQSDLSNATEYESEGENSEETPTNESNEPFKGSLLDSQSDLDNEIRHLVKRYLSNDSSLDNYLSISSMSREGENNVTFHQSQVLKGSNGRQNILSQEQTDASESDSDSESVSGSGEIYDYGDNGTKTEEVNTKNYSGGSKRKEVNSSILAETEEDWHSSDMKYDSRPNVYKIITIQPSNWVETEAKVVKLNLSSEISE